MTADHAFELEAVSVEEAAPTVEFMGEEFEIAETVGDMSRIWFGKMASDGADSDDIDGLAAMSDMIEDSLADGEYTRFRQHARRQKAQTSDLLEFVGKVLAATTERPTKRPSDSSVGQPVISEPSSDGPLEKAIARHAGRPDLQLQVVRAHTERSLASV